MRKQVGKKGTEEMRVREVQYGQGQMPYSNTCFYHLSKKEAFSRHVSVFICRYEEKVSKLMYI